MAVEERLVADMKTALKQGEKLRLSVVRMLRSELKNAQIAKGAPLAEAEVLEVLSRYARKRKEAAEECARGGRQDLVERELAEHAIVLGYLPSALSEAELAALVDAVIAEQGATGMKQMGAVMKVVMERAAGRAEGTAVSALVRARLSS
jgi:hypothetical protein